VGESLPDITHPEILIIKEVVMADNVGIDAEAKIEEVIVKIWDMAQANMKQDNPPSVRQATLEWAREELRQIVREE
jgi:hypothetical protein